MLEGLRAVQNTWIGKAILTGVMGIIVVSFVIFGIGDIFRGLGGNEVARVGSIGITVPAYRQAYATELQNLQQRARRPITNEEAHRFGLDGEVLSRMISDAVLDDRIDAMGLTISDKQMARMITGDPSFAGPGGGFDKSRFEAVLREQGTNEQSYVKEQRLLFLRQQLAQALVGDLMVPKAGLEALNRFQGETRAIDDLTLTAAILGPLPAPGDADLQTYFDAHKHTFDAPQYRRLVILGLTPAGVAKPDDVSDADAHKLYDAVKDKRYGTPERRTLQQMVFANEGDASVAAARIGSETSFSDIAQERKLDAKDIDLGSVTKGQIFDKGVADAAFSLPPDGTSAPVKTTFGAVLVHVVTIEAGALKPYEAVAGALKQELAASAAVNTIKTLHDRIEDARSSGKSLTEAAKAAGLETRTIESVDDKGLDKDGKPIEGLANRDAVLRAAFASDVGVDNDTVQGRDGSMTWFEVSAVEPAHAKPLSEVKAQVAAAWTEQETAKRLDDKAASLVKDLDAGQTLEQVAASIGNPPIAHADDVKRGGAPGLSSDVVRAVFDVPVGGAGAASNAGALPSATGAPGDRLLFRVKSSTVPPLDAAAPDMVQLAERYRNALSDDVLGAYLAKVGAEIGAKVNQDALRSAVGAGF